MKYLYRFAFGLLLGVLVGKAIAQDNRECRGNQPCNDDGSDLVTVQIEKGGASWGLGAGGPGDVDIDRCWGSTQVGAFTIFRQKLVTLETCLGFEFLAIKKYKLAAMHFCNDKDTLKEFDSEAKCETAHDFTPLGGAADVIRSLDETYEFAQQQEQEIEYLQEENASIVDRLERLTERLEQRPATVSSQVQTQIQRQESDAERRRARAKEAYQKAREGSE